MSDHDVEMVQIPRVVLETTLAKIDGFKAKLDAYAESSLKMFDEHAKRQAALLLEAVQTVIEAIPSVIYKHVPNAPPHAVQAITLAILEHANARLAAVQAAQSIIQSPPTD